MQFQIIWSEFAESQLDVIFEYHTYRAGETVALKLLRGIINAPQKLMKSPFIGKVEEMLSGRKTQYRFIIFKNYKLIYSVDEEMMFIKIADVFDVRQNPIKLKRVE